MDGAADAALGAWASVRGFFTPATLFVVVNLVIGTIALSSRFQQRRRRGVGYAAHDDDAHPHHEQQQQQPFHHQQENRYYDDQQQHHEHQYVPAPAPLARTSSVLDRLRSIGLYRFRSGDFPPEDAAGVATDSRDVAVAPAPDAQYARSRSEPAPVREERRRPAPSRMKKSGSEARTAEVPRVPAARVVRAPVLEEDDDVVEEYARPAPSRMKKSSLEARTAEVPPVRAARVVRAPVLEEDDDDFEEYARADEFTGNSFTTQPPPPAQHEVEEEEHYYREEYVPPLRPAPLARAPSVLERLRSFGLSRFRSGDLAADHASAAVDELARNHAQKQQQATTTQYSRSRSEPAREQSKKGKKQQQESAEARISKSGSVARKSPAPEDLPPVAAAEEGGVDARADDFINTFHKQLRLQRLNSLLNYKEMINRGA